MAFAFVLTAFAGKLTFVLIFEFEFTLPFVAGAEVGAAKK